MAQDENTPPITPDPAADLALASAIKSPRRSRLLPVLLSLNVLLLMGACAFVYMTYVAGGESPLGPSEAVASSEAAATADSDA
ncbi:MAG: hypothetical protein IMZ65_02885, partial [Planctomycetes bacterium]|nr:hypothetical protein [Planctomycetota bacterium]